LAVDVDRELAALDDEEHQPALTLECDLLSGVEAALVELVGEALEIPFVEVGEEADVAQERWGRLRHGAIHTRTAVPVSRRRVARSELLDPKLRALEPLDARPVELLAATEELDRLVHRHVTTLESRHDLFQLALQLLERPVCIHARTSSTRASTDPAASWM